MRKSHQALYRTYRPGLFKNVLGQDHVVSVLEKALSDNKLSHAYLFAGGRGTGKTSIARIIAKELKTADSDLYEIDAASNRGIDDVRALKESVQTLPFQSKYKVYIIDEVHMLTKEAFNALLKTLEEPPSHVIFILATTELEKLPETIISRCQTFIFKKPTEVILRAMVQDVATQEGYTLKPDAAELIAALGDGSYRDTYGILEKVLTYSSDKTISRDEVEKVSGAPQALLVRQFIEGVATKKPALSMQALAMVQEKNSDLKMFAKLAIITLRHIFLMRIDTALHASLKQELGTEQFNFCEQYAKDVKANISSKTLDILLGAYQKIDTASFVPMLPLELAVVELVS